MPKPLIPLAIASSMIFILSACGNSTQSITTGTETATAAPDAQGNSQPQTQSDIQGTVKSIVGNEFTIETIDMSGSALIQQMQDPEFRTKMQAMSDTERQEFMTKMQEERAKAKRVLVDVTIPVGTPVSILTGRGGFGGGGFPGGGGQRTVGQGGTSSGGLGASLGTTGGMTPPAGQTAPTQKQGTIAEIKVGSTVTIWLDKTVGDRKIAAWTNVSTATGGANGGGFGGGQGGNTQGGANFTRPQ